MVKPMVPNEQSDKLLVVRARVGMALPALGETKRLSTKMDIVHFGECSCDGVSDSGYEVAPDCGGFKYGTAGVMASLCQAEEPNELAITFFPKYSDISFFFVEHIFTKAR